MKSADFTPKFFHEDISKYLPMDLNKKYFLIASEHELNKDIYKSQYFDLLMLIVATLATIDETKARSAYELQNREGLNYLFKSLVRLKNPFAWLFDKNKIDNMDQILEGLQAFIISTMDICIYNPINYVLSHNLSKILLGIKPPQNAKNIILDMIKNESSLCFRFKNLESLLFRNISIYIYKNSEILNFVFTAKSKKTNSPACAVAYTTPKKFIDQTEIGLILRPFVGFEDRDFLKKIYSIFEKDIYILINLTINSLFYISSPTRDTIINEKIAEFASKRKKRAYQEKHFSSQLYTEVDLNHEKVRAYEQGKSWFRKGHTRWQPCGKGKKETKLIFLAPQFPTRKKLF